MDLSGRNIWDRATADLLIILAAAIMMTLPIFLFGIPSGNDLPQHYQFAQAFYDSLQNGTVYPSWPGHTNLGFGDVGIRFYPPFSYYVLCFFRWLSGNWFDASAISFCFWFFIGSLGIYLWAREWFGRNASLAAALTYLFMPYHANQLYNAFFYAEFAAAAILPFCFLFVTRVCRTGKTGDGLGLTLSFGLLLLTHIPLSVIGSLALLLYSMVSLPAGARLKTLAKLGLFSILGIAASGFYWVRTVTELAFLNHASREFTRDAYDYHNNFLAAFLYTSSTNYEARALWFGDLVLLITMGLFVPGALVYYKQRNSDQPRLLNLLVILALGLFLATPLSLPLWENLAILQKLQFPFRWMVVISIAGALFAAAGFDPLIASFRTKLRPAALAGFGLIIAGFLFTGTQVIHQAVFLDRTEFASMINRNSTAVSFECWWPVWANEKALDDRQMVSTGDRHVVIEKWEETERNFEVAPGKPTLVRVATFYYPFWRATVNGEDVAVTMDELGAIRFSIPSEESEVSLFFDEPAYVRAANGMAVFTWVLLGTAALILFLRLGHKRKWNSSFK